MAARCRLANQTPIKRVFTIAISNNLGPVSTARAAQAIPILGGNLIRRKEESHRQREGLMTYCMGDMTREGSVRGWFRQPIVALDSEEAVFRLSVWESWWKTTEPSPLISWLALNLKGRLFKNQFYRLRPALRIDAWITRSSIFKVEYLR